MATLTVSIEIDLKKSVCFYCNNPVVIYLDNEGVLQAKPCIVCLSKAKKIGKKKEGLS